MLLDQRFNAPLHWLAPVDEVMALQDLYSSRYPGWNVRHFYGCYQREHTASCSYSWVKNQLQGARLVRQSKTSGPHRKRREPSALAVMMVHQDGSMHQRIEGIYWDLIITMDDATNEHHSMFFGEEEGTRSIFLEVRDVLDVRALLCSFYSDRGSHYWHTLEAGGKVDKVNLTQFDEAMKRLWHPNDCGLLTPSTGTIRAHLLPIRGGSPVSWHCTALPI